MVSPFIFMESFLFSVSSIGYIKLFNLRLLCGYFIAVKPAEPSIYLGCASFISCTLRKAFIVAVIFYVISARGCGHGKGLCVHHLKACVPGERILQKAFIPLGSIASLPFTSISAKVCINQYTVLLPLESISSCIKNSRLLFIREIPPADACGVPSVSVGNV